LIFVTNYFEYQLSTDLALLNTGILFPFK